MFDENSLPSSTREFLIKKPLKHPSNYYLCMVDIVQKTASKVQSVQSVPLVNISKCPSPETFPEEFISARLTFPKLKAASHYARYKYNRMPDFQAFISQLYTRRMRKRSSYGL
jgi:hypothetical protein